VNLTFDERLRRAVASNLAGFDRRPSSRDGLRSAAVAIVLLSDADGRACFVLTRRPVTMRRHPGQYALPGGRLDDGETTVVAALRETHEEIGLLLEADHVLGCLDDYETRSGFCITPVVVWGGADVILEPNPGEVAALYRVPLEALLRPNLVHLDAIPESDRPVLSLSLLDNRIFAPTAALLLQLREVALLNKHTRVDGYEQPLFAWR
jgi:8-oxo-dGTP pyrophosphatase MutT (NUDIX family)